MRSLRTKSQELEAQEAKVLVVDAGFIGVEWVTELEYFSQNKLTIIDFLPKCLGPLPDSAAEYYSEYLSAGGIEEFCERKYDRKNEEFCSSRAWVLTTLASSWRPTIRIGSRFKSNWTRSRCCWRRSSTNLNWTLT